MSSDFVLSITTKDTPKQKNPIHVVMWEGTDGTQELLERISQLEKAIHKLTERQSSIFFPTALYPTPCGIEVKSRSNSFTNEFDLNVFRTISKVSGPDASQDAEEEKEQEQEEVDIDEIVNSMKEMDMDEDDMLEGEEEQEEQEVQEEQEDQEVEETKGEEQEVEETKEEEQEETKEEVEETKEEVEETKEEGVEEEHQEVEEEEEDQEVEEEEEYQEEVEEEEEYQEEVEEEEEDQEAEEFKEFLWKGQTYYKDSENLVYQLDTDGDLIDTPIGIWKEESQKLVKYKAV
jgi:primosomal protein N'